jgi:D-aminoacyl-tRNA deacylase
MRAVVQRVREAAVAIDGREVARIGVGLLVLVGVETGDTPADAAWLAGKVVALRIFADEEGKMNFNVQDIGGSTLAVSQFTLHADTAKGNRPGFTRAAKPNEAIPLYEMFLADLERKTGCRPERGVFAAAMQVSLINDGPVTILIDSRQREG